MAHMIFKRGCKVPFPEKIKEGYMVTDNGITANVGSDKIEGVMQHFIAMHDEPLFFILELPSDFDDEEEIRQGVLEKTHKDIYYIDGCSQEEAIAIMLRVGELLFNDGLISFGYGCHESEDEIMFGKYNVTTIFSHRIKDYDDFFEPHDIHKVDNVLTAWETFSREHPGVSEKILVDGKDVYSIPEQFTEWGMYKAEQRED